ncbi:MULTISPECIES: tetratricopeptide repeat protein [unclassified Microbulbifer]|uniref:tetratricopeptide repeat protein n=1 Tax=unclassified Microbulbifer TaxID=2619833 RepID=UPI0027E4B760|nr:MULTISPECIES: tetratricopeptide repeat protein [unclassified Microbulbifer]
MKLDVSELLERLYEEKKWSELDEKISERDLAEYKDDITLFRYKLIAMANIEGRNTCDELIRIAEIALNIKKETLFYNILADAHIARENPNLAINILNSWKSIDPENPNIFQLLFYCHKQLNDEQGMTHAALYFHFFSGKALQASLNFEASCEHLYNTCKMAPKFDYAAYLYAQGLMFSGKPLRATEVAATVSDESPFSLGKMEIMARLASFQSVPDVVDGHIESILDIDASNPVALRCRAKAAEDRKDIMSAIAAYQKIVEFYPFDVLASLKIVQLSMAIVENISIGMTILDSEKLRLSEILFHAGQSDAGSILLEGISPKSESYLDARIALANNYINSQNFIEALEVIRVTDDSTRMHTTLLQLEAESLFQLNRHEEAAQISQNSLEIDPDNLRCHFLLGASLIKINESNTRNLAKVEGSIRPLLGTYIDRTPNDGLPHVYLAQLTYSLGQADGIPNQIRLARGKGHLSPLGSYLMGQYNLSVGDFSAALAEFTDAVDLSGRNIYYEAQIARAELNHKLGNMQRALDDVEEILTHWPNNQRAGALRQLLQISLIN